jgi:hypothetical protein
MTDKTPPLDRVLIAIQLAESCISNAACYSAGWEFINKNKYLINNNDFWTRSNGNFLDTATLEWCKLFIDKSTDKRSPGEYSWKNIFPDHSKWLSSMLIATNIEKNNFKEHGLAIINYRNKYLAHREKTDFTLYYPKIEIITKTASYLHASLLKDAGHSISGHYETITDLYNEKFNLARKEILFSLKI